MPVVKNQAELDAAIKAAKGGETILLAPGTYTTLFMYSKNPAVNITIQSQDPNNKAVFGALKLNASSNITIKDVDFVRTATPSTDLEVANLINSSSNITLDGVKFSGGTGDPSNAKGTGIRILGGSNNKMINSSIDHYVIGMAVRGGANMLVQNNYFHDNRRDHTNFAEMTNVTIDSNRFEGLYPIGDEHPDAIQFMTNGASIANTNVNITNNVVLQGEGRGTQGFFLGEENGDLPYKNVTIQNNLIYLSGWYHGINLVHAENAKIDSNTIISAPDAKSTWIRVQGVTGSVTNNLTDQLTIESNSNVTTSNNVQLVNSPSVLRSIADINKGAQATVYGLMMKGVGYAPVPGSAMAALVDQQKAAAAALPPAGPKLLLDLNFTSKGVVDTSGWSSDDPTKAVAATAISNNLLHVKTGSGMELARTTSQQLFNMSAFTLNFNMQRSSTTGSVGQIIGIYKSWGVSLRSDGELSFTMTNDAGVTSTLVTSGAKIKDTALHKIALSYDSNKKTATLYVDGVARGTATMSGSTRKVASWGLYVGTQFGTSFSGGVGDIEIRDTAYSAAQILALNAGNTQTPAATAADTLKVMVAKGVAESAATLAGDTSWGSAMSSPATLTLAGAFGSATATQSPLATALANAGLSGSLATGAGSFSTFSKSRVAALDLYHA